MKVAGGGPSVHACAVFFRTKSRDGDKLGQTPYMPSHTHTHVLYTNPLHPTPISRFMNNNKRMPHNYDRALSRPTLDCHMPRHEALPDRLRDPRITLRARLPI